MFFRCDITKWPEVVPYAGNGRARIRAKFSSVWSGGLKRIDNYLYGARCWPDLPSPPASTVPLHWPSAMTSSGSSIVVAATGTGSPR